MLTSCLTLCDRVMKKMCPMIKTSWKYIDCGYLKILSMVVTYQLKNQFDKLSQVHYPYGKAPSFPCSKAPCACWTMKCFCNRGINISHELAWSSPSPQLRTNAHAQIGTNVQARTLKGGNHQVATHGKMHVIANSQEEFRKWAQISKQEHKQKCKQDQIREVEQVRT